MFGVLRRYKSDGFYKDHTTKNLTDVLMFLVRFVRRYHTNVK